MIPANAQRAGASLSSAARVAIVADSLALPRPAEIGLLRFDETYPHQLEVALQGGASTAGVKLLLNARRARLMREVPWEIGEALWNGASGIIVHVGICDCGPRVMSKVMHTVVDHVRPLAARQWIVERISANRRRILNTLGPRVYTTKAAFRRDVGVVARALVEAELRLSGFVNMAPPDAALEYKSPGYRANVVAYNGILQQEATGAGIGVIDLFAAIEAAGGMERCGIEGQHLNATGGAILTGLLLDRIRDAYER